MKLLFFFLLKFKVCSLDFVYAVSLVGGGFIPDIDFANSGVLTMFPESVAGWTGGIYQGSGQEKESRFQGEASSNSNQPPFWVLSMLSFKQDLATCPFTSVSPDTSSSVIPNDAVIENIALSQNIEIQVTFFFPFSFI